MSSKQARVARETSRLSVLVRVLSVMLLNSALEEYFSDDLGGRNVQSFRNVREKRETGECPPRFSERHAADPKAGINVAT